MATGKKHRSDVFSEHHHLLFVEIVAFADESALECRRVRVHLSKIGLYAAEINARHFSGLRAHRMPLVPARHQKCRDILDRRTALLQRPSVLQREGFALPFLERWRPAVAALVPLADERGIRAELLDVFLNFLVKAG